MHRFIFFNIIVLLLSSAQAKPAVEAFAEGPDIQYLRISPNGERLAYLTTNGNQEIVNVINLSDQSSVYAVDTTKTKVRGVRWAGDDFLILSASNTSRIFGYSGGRTEYHAAHAIDLNSKKIQHLLVDTREVYTGQSGLGRIVGFDDDGKHAFMPAYTAPVGTYNLTYDLLKVDLQTGRGQIIHRGRRETIDWVTNGSGEAIAREDYDNKLDRYLLWTKVSGKWEVILEESSDDVPYSMVGIKEDGSSLIFIEEDSDEDSQSEGVFELSLETNKFSEPLYVQENREIDYVYRDENRRVYGVSYSGLTGDDLFFDPKLNADIAAFRQKIAPARAEIWTMSDDRKKIIFRLEFGIAGSGRAILLDRETGSISGLAAMRSRIPTESVGTVFQFQYEASDGLIIPSVITFPPGTKAATARNLPLVLLPHGGPAGYDDISFDWMAQFFANEGYAVLQPNFRGSNGFGVDHYEAGHGEWGGKMQDDLTDGVQAMIDVGWVDPSKVCIVGWSYGGYAALMGEAKTPNVYKCVIAGAGVSDLRKMLVEERDSAGKYHWVVDYWERQMGAEWGERHSLDAISPVNFAARFDSPVLLIHGRDDLVVPPNQSHQMRRALEAANKDVKMIELKDEDHWLSRRETRIEALREMGDFLAENLKD